MPFDVFARRDPKGLYQAAWEGCINDFTGPDSPYEVPSDSDVEVNVEARTLEIAAEQLMTQRVEKRLIAPVAATLSMQST